MFNSQNLWFTVRDWQIYDVGEIIIGKYLVFKSYSIVNVANSMM